MKRLKILGRCLVVLGVAVWGAGCGGGGGGGDDDGDGGPGAQVGAFNFTSQNMNDAAGLAVGDSDLYAIFTDLLLGLRSELIAGPGRLAPAQVSFGDLGICTTGAATLVWDDADDSGSVSSGDSASLTFEDCVLDGPPVNGALSLTLSTVALPGLMEGTLDLQVTFLDNLDGTPVTGGLAVKCGISLSNTLQVDYGAIYTYSAEDEVLTFTADGVIAYQFSCGQVSHFISPWYMGKYLVAPAGVVNVPSVGLFTVVAPSGGGLFYAEEVAGADAYPDDGGVRILSMGECALFGAPNGVGDSTGHYIDVSALPGDGDDLRLDLYDDHDALLETRTVFLSEIW